MMRTPSGSYSDPGLQREVRELRKQVDVLSRRKVEMPKVPPPVAGWQLSGFTRATAGSVAQTGAGYIFGAWDFDSTWSNFGWDDAGRPPQLVSINDQVFGNRDPGWFWQRIRYGTDSSASRLTIVVNNSGTSGGIDSASYYVEHSVTRGAGGNYAGSFFAGPFWLPASSPAEGRGPFRFEATFPFGESPSHTFFRAEIDVIG